MSSDQPTPDQSERLLSVTTPLGDNKLVLERYRGREELSRPFQFSLDMLSTETSIDASSIVGQSVTISVQLPSGDAHYINGMVSRFSAGSQESWESGYRRYRAELVPWLWFLSLKTDCKIYQNQSVTDIIEAVFSDAGFSDYQTSLSGTYSPLIYCVQYNESAFAFVSRLMEWAGIYYYFTHDNGKHTMVLCDDATGYADCQESSVDFQDRFDSQLWGQINSWEHHYEFVAGKAALTDYNFEDPDTSLLTNSSATSDVDLSGIDSYEVFEYPGYYATTSDGQPITDVRMGEQDARYSVAQGTSSCASFFVGGKFTPNTHSDDSEQGQSYALLSVEHDVREPARYTTTTADEKSNDRGPISNTFRAIPASIKFRPARNTPKPRIKGPQSAIVVGTQGNEIDTDQYGRIKVQFYWDRYGQNDENSSCWIRVVQRWADNSWGAHFTPRIGEEVLVEFLGGDPDRPIVTGCLYNANLMPPYALPDNATRSGIKTHSSPDGDEGASNEICFEDKTGSENFYVHAQKDYNRVVENNETTQVGNDNSDDGSQAITVYNNRSVTIQQGDDTLDIQTGNRAITVDQGNDSLEVKAGDRSIKVDQGNDSLEVSAGSHSIKVSAGSSTVEAAQSITLKVGSNSIEVSQQGITINGMQVSIQGTTQAELKSTMTSINGDATTAIKGGIVQIN